MLSRIRDCRTHEKFVNEIKDRNALSMPGLKIDPICGLVIFSVGTTVFKGMKGKNVKIY